MRTYDSDVLVVGAGEGGAAAAYYPTQAGQRVLVVEKETLPRDKPCGGAIPRPTLDRFPFACNGLVQAAPAEVRFAFPGLSLTDVPLPYRPVVMVMRSEFDAFLLNRSGAEVLDGNPITSLSETRDSVRVTVCERTFTARYLVGTDGAVSVVAQHLGLRRHRQLAGSLEAEVPLEGHKGLRTASGSRALLSMAPVPWSYAWIFPKGDRLSVGIVQLRSGRVDLRLALDREMDRLGISLDGAKVRGHPLPCYQALTRPWWRGEKQEKLSTRRCFLVGDAAGLVDSLLGEGSRYAIHGAQLVAEAIVRGNLAGYEAAAWRDIGHSLATAGLVADLFYRWPRQCFDLSLRNPATTRHFGDLLTERSSYQGIGRRLSTSTARWLLGGARREMSDKEWMLPAA
jgi:geranylgeranyl reductase family protein